MNCDSSKQAEATYFCVQNILNIYVEVEIELQETEINWCSS